MRDFIWSYTSYSYALMVSVPEGPVDRTNLNSSTVVGRSIICPPTVLQIILFQRLELLSALDYYCSAVNQI